MTADGAELDSATAWVIEGLRLDRVEFIDGTTVLHLSDGSRVILRPDQAGAVTLLYQPRNRP